MAKPSSNDLAITWLESMSNSTDIWDAVNAGQALALINDQKRRLASLGSAFNNIKKQRDKVWEAMKEAQKGLQSLQKKDSEDLNHGYFCDYCKMFVPSEVIRTTESFCDPEPNVRPLYIRICLRCGNQVFDKDLEAERIMKEEEDERA